MNLEEAIEHATAVADSYKDTDPDCQCARDHRRLAKWLTELKMARESAFAQIPQMARTISENHSLKAENAKLRELAVGMYGMFEMFDKMLGNHDACETPRPLIFGKDKSFKDAMRELGMEVQS